MDRKRIMRLLGALLCAALLFTDVPADVLRAAADDVVPAAAEAEVYDPAQPPEDVDEPEGEPDSSEEAEVPAEEAAETADSDLAALTAGWVGDMDAQGVSGDYDRALWLYDRLIVNFEPGGPDDALGAMMGLQGSALGYARAYEALLRAAGVECLTVSAAGDAWNLAELDGTWTHIDAYRDDAPGCYGLHFGLSDAAMARDHTLPAELPECIGAQNSYFARELGYRAFAGIDELRAALEAALDAGESELYLYNCGEPLALGEVLPALLAELAPGVEIEIVEQGCYAAVTLRAGAEPEVANYEEALDEQPLLAAAASIEPSVESLTLGKGEKAVVGYTLQPLGALPEDVEYSCAPKGIVTVSQLGEVVAKKAGSATVTLSTASGLRVEVPVTVKKSPSSVSIVGDRKELGVGETMQLGYKLSSGAAGQVAFSISKGDQYASVTPDGLITALAPGKFTLSAKAYNGKKAKAVSMEVKFAPTQVIPPVEELRIGLGDRFTPEWALDAGAAGKLRFSSSNESIASVDPDSGEITALSLGEAEITADAYGVASGTMPVRVVPPATSLELRAARSEIGVKEKLQLEPALSSNGAPFEGNACTLTYKSSKTSIATVSAEGLVTAKKAGSATITAASPDGRLQAQIAITVKKAPGSVTIIAKRRELGVGETMYLGYKLPKNTAGAVTFSAPEGQSVVEVAPDGAVTARGEGSVTVTAKTHNGKKKTVKLTVKPAPSSIEIVGAPAKLGLTDSADIAAKLSEGSAGPIFYRLIDAQPADGASEVAYIGEDGEITALGIGTVTVEAFTYVEGLRATAQLEVVPSPDALILPQEKIEIGIDDSYQISPRLIPEGSAASFTYASKKKSYATVSESGLVKGKKAGSTVISIEVHNGASAQLSVEVKKKPSKVTLSPDALTLGVGERYTLEAQFPKNTAGTLTYASDDESIASVAPDGTVTALAPGTTTVRVATYNGKTDSCSVTVTAPATGIRFADNYRMGVGQRDFTPSYEVEPAGARVGVQFELLSGDAVEVNGDKINAVKQGEATIRANTPVEGVSDEFTVSVLPAPDSISLPEYFPVAIDDASAALLPEFAPADSAAGLRFEITGKKKDFFSIDADTGRITPLALGWSEVTVTTHNGKSATTTVWVVQALDRPELIEYLGESPVYLYRGRTYAPELRVFPEGADPDLAWETSDSEIASVDADGTVHGLDYGRATITATSRSNPNLTILYKVIVLSEERCLKMPQHRTDDKSTIVETERQILEVRKSAYAELDELAGMGWISASERSKRQSYVDRAFEMYNFAWTPNDKKLYWKEANSEGGEKDFKPDIYYFGMPYTQDNRVNYLDKLVDNGYMVEKSSYYLTTDKFKSRSYPGSDCSSYCSMAVWGFDSDHRGDNTRGIASASYYTTLGSKYWTDLRPGDLICLSGHHVVMFLYYSNSARTQFVVIEQGGGGDDPYSNCVSTSIRDATYYQEKNYKIRRPSSLATNYVADR